MNEWTAKARKSRNNKKYYETHKEPAKRKSRAKNPGKYLAAAARRAYRDQRAKND